MGQIFRFVGFRGRIKRTSYLIILLICFILGLACARRVSFYNPYGICYILFLLSPLLYIRFRMLSLLSIVLLVFCLGLWRGTVFKARLLPYQYLIKQKITISAVAASDSIYSDKGQLSFDVKNIKLVEATGLAAGHYIDLVGVIAVKGYGVPAVYKGDKVRVEAKLYPTRGSRQATMSYSKIEVLARGYSIIDNLRRKFAAGMMSSVAEPMGSFGLGILIGQRTTLPEEVNQQLSIVGLTHIVAVSGYNLTIIVRFVHGSFKKSSKLMSTIMTVGLITLFLLLTDFSASIVRAAIVSLLSILAWYYGRTFRPVMVLMLSAAITAGYYPVYLWSDIGWYLSFLAFFGVLVIGPVFQSRFFPDENRQPKLLLAVVIETLAAQIMTLPLIMFIFGRLSIIALLANILVVPLVSLAMLLSFVAGLAGMFMPGIAGWLAWPATRLLSYMLDTSAILSRVPYASVDSKLSLLQIVVSYCLIFAVLLMWWKKIPPSVKIKGLVN
jgi:ComEC/Rec2-related protein